MKVIENVIVVEDDPIASLIISKKLEKHARFIHCRAFANGKLSIEYIQSAVKDNGILPDLILLDINMPVMNGWEFLDAFQKVQKQKPIPVIMLTSSIDPQDIEKASTYKEVKGYFPKPLTNDSLEQIIALIE
jgi:CheY-like chemotaxis protein